MVAAGRYLDEEPALALEHALAARRLASRIGVVREAVGLAAYHAGEWQTAVSELRTYHRMSGKQTHLAVLADCERALGRPERAIDLYRTVERRSASTSEAIELLIVAAGARADMGQNDASVAMLQVRELTADAPWVGRLRYAYADALLSVGRRDEARDWFARAVDADPEGETDAAERLLDLDGITLESDDEGDPELALLMAHEELGEQAATEAPAQGAEAIAGDAGEGTASSGADEGDKLDDDNGFDDVDDDDDDDLDDDDDFDDVDDLDDDDDLDVDDDDDLDNGFVGDEDDDDLDDEDDDEDDDETGRRARRAIWTTRTTGTIGTSTCRRPAIRSARTRPTINARAVRDHLDAPG